MQNVQNLLSLHSYTFRLDRTIISVTSRWQPWEWLTNKKKIWFLQKKRWDWHFDLTEFGANHFVSLYRIAINKNYALHVAIANHFVWLHYTLRSTCLHISQLSFVSLSHKFLFVCVRLCLVSISRHSLSFIWYIRVFTLSVLLSANCLCVKCQSTWA